MQPGLALGVVAAAVDRFVENVGVMSAEPGHLLAEPTPGLGHQIAIALVPEVVSMSEGPGDAVAGRFERVLAHGLGVERREIAVPVDDFVPIAVCVNHVGILTPDSTTAGFSVRGLLEGDDPAARRQRVVNYNTGISRFWESSAMAYRLPAFILAILLAASVSWAQVAEPNRAGVAMGHLHYRVRDVAANTRFWTTLGGVPMTVGDTGALRFPGVLVLLSPGDSSGGSDGSVLNHVAFRVQSLAEIEARGLAVQRLAQFPGVASVYTPEGERVELFDATATNLTFVADAGLVDPVAERHNRPLAGPIASHHVHLYLPKGAELEAKAWYARMFGATPGKRSNYQAADLPGINLNFSENPGERGPTRGRMLDHLGFEVVGLDAFCRRLEAAGVRLDEPYRRDAAGIGWARLTDPWGTSIELTEGLSGL